MTSTGLPTHDNVVNLPIQRPISRRFSHGGHLSKWARPANYAVADSAVQHPFYFSAVPQSRAGILAGRASAERSPCENYW